MWNSIVTSTGLLCDLSGAALLAYGVISWRSSYREIILRAGLKNFEAAKEQADANGNSWEAEFWKKQADRRHQELELFENETESINASLALWGITLLIAGFALQLVGVWIGD